MAGVQVKLSYQTNEGKSVAQSNTPTNPQIAANAWMWSSSVQWADNLKFLTVFRDTRDPGFPDVPTIKQQGHDIPPINEVIYVNASPGVPQDRFARLVSAFTKAFENPELIAQQKKINVIVTPMTSAQLRSVVQKAFDLANEYKAILTE